MYYVLFRFRKCAIDCTLTIQPMREFNIVNIVNGGNNVNDNRWHQCEGSSAWLVDCVSLHIVDNFRISIDGIHIIWRQRRTEEANLQENTAQRIIIIIIIKTHRIVQRMT